jgi:hypothetical protein
LLTLAAGGFLDAIEEFGRWSNDAMERPPDNFDQTPKEWMKK